MCIRDRCDVTGDYPVVLRQGLVSREMIERAVGRCEVYVPKEGEQVRSPGMKYKHYAPKCKTCLFDDPKAAVATFADLKKQGNRVYVLCESKYAEMFSPENVLDLGRTPEEMASRLYSLLRQGEKVADVIVAVRPQETGLSLIHIFVTHSNADPELVELAKSMVEELFDFEEIDETVAGSIITSHCGRNTLGVLFITK